MSRGVRGDNAKSTLTPVFRKGYWVARGYIPIRQRDGTIAKRRVERSIGSDCRTAAQRQAYCDQLNGFYQNRALSVEKPMTFAKAYTNYVKAGKPVPGHGQAILKEIGVMQCADVDDSVMLDMAKKLFAADAKPSYVNRHLYTPVIAILKMASKSKACAPPNLTRPRGHKDVTPIDIPDRDWFKEILPLLSQNMKALLMLLTIHGRRLGDALARKPSDFNAQAKTLYVGKTKNGDLLLVDLLPQVSEMIAALPDWEKREWLFGYGPASASNVRRDILIACLKAADIPLNVMHGPGGVQKAKKALSAKGMRYFSPHSIGRHSFATRMLRDGYSLQYVKDAGGWKTIEMVSSRYGHLERKETTQAVHQVGNNWLGISATSGENGGKARIPPPKDPSKNQ